MTREHPQDVDPEISDPVCSADTRVRSLHAEMRDTSCDPDELGGDPPCWAHLLETEA